jgi:hypothetical protein
MITQWLPGLEAPPEVLLYIVAGGFLTLVTLVVAVAVFHPDPIRRADARKVLRTLRGPGPGGG